MTAGVKPYPLREQLRSKRKKQMHYPRDTAANNSFARLEDASVFVMPGKYQVGSGRIVTVTHDTPFIDNIVPTPPQKVKTIFPTLLLTVAEK